MKIIKHLKYSLLLLLAFNLQHLKAARAVPIAQYNVGVFYQPSWNFKPSSGRWVDSMWSCLVPDYTECSFVMPGSPTWGQNGRDYTDDPRPDFSARKPVPELGGFYNPLNKEVIKKQLSIMKNHEIDYLIYNWFWGRHYYYQVPDQFNTYYPKDWEIHSKPEIFGRVKVPGIEQWAEQLHAILEVNETLPLQEQMKFALNWCDDSDHRWMGFMNMGSPETLARKENFLGEAPTATLFMETHRKMVHLWADKYFIKPYYLKDEKGRPVVYFYFPQDVEARASLFNISMKELIDEANKVAITKGFPGIKFIAVLAGAMHVNEVEKYGLPTKWVPNDPAKLWLGGSYTNKISMQKYADSLIAKGFEGMTSYIYHSYSAVDNDLNSQNLFNKNFEQMSITYRAHWDRWVDQFKVTPSFDYQIPVAMGWDNRPNGGTWYNPGSGKPTERDKDFGHGSKASYKALLTGAKAKSDMMKRNITLCCWNEYTEGNYIEPTVGTGYMFVEAIKEVFGRVDLTLPVEIIDPNRPRRRPLPTQPTPTTTPSPRTPML